MKLSISHSHLSGPASDPTPPYLPEFDDDEPTQPFTRREGKPSAPCSGAMPYRSAITGRAVVVHWP